MAKNKKCPICKKEYPDMNKLSYHLESRHPELIPTGMTGGKYLFYRNHNRTHGSCVECKKPTPFNDVTFKPARYCGDPRCIDNYRRKRDARMMKVHGVTTLLNDADHQNKMLSNRSIAKDYTWSDGSRKKAIGSYEYDCLRFLDDVLNMSSSDVFFPAPFTLSYEYDGKTRMYIPDGYIASLNLILEIKESDNTHHKIQAVDRVKTKCKENALIKYKYNYVKVLDKKYGTLIKTIDTLKNSNDVGNPDDSGSRYAPVIVTENTSSILTEIHNLAVSLAERTGQDISHLSERTYMADADKILGDSISFIKFSDKKIDFIVELGILYKGIVLCWRNDVLQTTFLADVVVDDICLVRGSDNVDLGAFKLVLGLIDKYLLTSPIDPDMDYDLVNAVILAITSIAHLEGVPAPFDQFLYTNITSFDDIVSVFNPAPDIIKSALGVSTGSDSETSAIQNYDTSAIVNHEPTMSITMHEATQVIERYNAVREAMMSSAISASPVGRSKLMKKAGDIKMIYNSSHLDQLDADDEEYVMAHDAITILEGLYTPISDISTIQHKTLHDFFISDTIIEKNNNILTRLKESLVDNANIDIALMDEREALIKKLNKSDSIIMEAMCLGIDATTSNEIGFKHRSEYKYQTALKEMNTDILFEAVDHYYNISISSIDNAYGFGILSGMKTVVDMVSDKFSNINIKNKKIIRLQSKLNESVKGYLFSTKN